MDDALQLFQQAMLMTLSMSAPPLAIAAILGLVISVVMTMFQLQEQTIPFAVKLVAVFFTLLLLGPWMGGQIMLLLQQVFALIPYSG